MRSYELTRAVCGPVDYRNTFSSVFWLNHFRKNKAKREKEEFVVPESVALPAATKAALVASLQRFQLGETGDGEHIKKLARIMSDPVYEQCIDLFIKEEQSHAAVLAKIIKAMDGKLITWHWSDVAFVTLRRLLGLKTEIVILQCAEVIGKCFYAACARNIKDADISRVFASIVEDEKAHLKFHWSFVKNETLMLYPSSRTTMYKVWKFGFAMLCLVFIADHYKALRVLGVKPRDFFADCMSTFNRAAIRALISA